MRRLISSVCVAFVILFLFAMIPFEGECRSISDDVFRVHILANSDSDNDQNLKLKVRDAIIEESNELLKDAHSKEDAEIIVGENLEHFAEVAYDVIATEGYDYSVSAQINNVCFDTRYYENNITMPGGYYDALQIKIGKAEGKNWWCVMYPSLCISTAADRDNLENKLTKEQYSIVSSRERYVLRLKIVEIYNSVVNYFSQ